jgi:hypothetical protein
MLTARLFRFLHYNIQQYIALRNDARYTDAVGRLRKMAKLIHLIENTCAAGNNLTADEAMLIERAQLHLTALGVLTSS